MLDAGWVTDLVGLGIGIVLFAYQKRFVTAESIAHGKD